MCDKIKIVQNPRSKVVISCFDTLACPMCSEKCLPIKKPSSSCFTTTKILLKLFQLERPIGHLEHTKKFVDKIINVPGFLRILENSYFVFDKNKFYLAKTTRLYVCKQIFAESFLFHYFPSNCRTNPHFITLRWRVIFKNLNPCEKDFKYFFV